MRLIDADDFMERMKCDTDLCAEMEQDGLKALKKYLDLQPTAYDIGKVVEELEATKETACGLLKIPNFLKKDLQELVNMCFDEAIEIVKQGGIGKDVSE